MTGQIVRCNVCAVHVNRHPAAYSRHQNVAGENYAAVARLTAAAAIVLQPVYAVETDRSSKPLKKKKYYCIIKSI